MSSGLPLLNRVRRSIAKLIRRENPRRISILDRSTLLFLIVTSVWFLLAYMIGNDTPSVRAGETPGWLAWYDQGRYMESTAELSRGELKPSHYWLGYPVLGVPFYYLLPRHPYLLPDLVLVLVMVGAFYCCARHCMGRPEAWVLIGVFIFFNPILRDQCMVIPWNTLPAYAAIYLSAYLLVFARPSWNGFVVSALMSGVALFARPNEVLPLGALYLVAAFNWKDRRRWWALALFAVMFLLVSVVTAGLNFHFYGKLSSPYMNSENSKFSYWNLGLKLYQLCCDGAFLTGDSVVPGGTRTIQILERYPYFLLLLPGLIYLVRFRGARAWGLALAIILSVGFYLTYDLVNSPAYFWSYGSYHYFWWVIPWLGFFTYLSLRQAPFTLRWPVYAIALVIPVAVYLFVGFKAVEVAASDATNLVVATGYQSQIFTATITSKSDFGTVEDIRVVFSIPPPYFGSSVDAENKVTVKVNGRDMALPQDFMFSQAGKGPYDFAFLAHRLLVMKGDVITLTFSDPTPPVLQRVSFRQVRFAPGQAVARLFTP